MAVFMDESGIVTKDVQLFKREILRSNFTTITSHQCPFPQLQFTGHRTRNFLLEQHTLLSDCQAHSVVTITDNRIKIGGDATKYRFNSLMFLRKSLLA